MTIVPLASGRAYRSSAVYTTVNGKRVFVSDGYTASSRSEIIRLALNNADIRRRITLMSNGMRMG